MNNILNYLTLTFLFCVCLILVVDYTIKPELVIVSLIYYIYVYVKKTSVLDLYNLVMIVTFFLYPIYWVQYQYISNLWFLIPLALIFLSIPNGLNNSVTTSPNIIYFTAYLCILYLLSLFGAPSLIWWSLLLLCCNYFYSIVQTKTTIVGLLCGVLLCGAVIAKMYFSWSGFGRLVFVSAFMIIFGLYYIGQRVSLPLASIPIIGIASLTALQATRASSVDSAELVFLGSAGHHVIVTNDIMRYQSSLDPIGFIGQVFLTIFNFFPRAIYPEKPYGVGYSSVSEIYPNTDYGENYSHSVGFVGEAFYYLGEYYLIGLIIYFFIFYIYFKVGKKLFGLQNDIYVLVFYTTMFNYIWGGGAAFGGRIWEPLIALILVEVYLRLRKIHGLV